MANSDKLTHYTQDELAQYLVDTFRRAVLHYGLWFNEVNHQLGLQEALKIEEAVSQKVAPLAVEKLARTLGFPVRNNLPGAVYDMPKDKLIELINTLAVIWLVGDGVWFQEVENRHDMYTSKRCNDTCWVRFSPLEASMIQTMLRLPDNSGLDGLQKGLELRLVARIDNLSIERVSENEIIFKIVNCRVQDARRRKGLADYPCKSVGITEYTNFAKYFSPDIRTECLECPPDEHPTAYACAWRFYTPKD